MVTAACREQSFQMNRVTRGKKIKWMYGAAGAAVLIAVAVIAIGKFGSDRIVKAVPVRTENPVVIDLKSKTPGSPGKAVSYTHLTLPTNREV